MSRSASRSLTRTDRTSIYEKITTRSLPLDRFWSSELTESSAQKFFPRGPDPTVSPSIFFAFDFKGKFARFELTAVSTTIAIIGRIRGWSNAMGGAAQRLLPGW